RIASLPWVCPIILRRFLHPRLALDEPLTHGQVGHPKFPCHLRHGVTQPHNPLVVYGLCHWWRAHEQGGVMALRVLGHRSQMVERGVEGQTLSALLERRVVGAK